MRLRPRSVPFLYVASLALGGCSGHHAAADAGVVDAAVVDAAPPDAGVVPIFRNPVDLADDALATQALALMGGNVAGASDDCNDCHALTRQSLRYWRAIGDQAQSTCLTDLAVTSAASAKTMLDCLRDNPGQAGSPFRAEKLGPAAAAARLPWFAYTFHKAYGDAWQPEYQEFLDRAAMPKGTHPPFSQAQFDIVAEWFARGLPALEATLPEDPLPTTCTPGVSADVASHVESLRLTGWHAVNQDHGILMFGCGGAATPRDCLSTYPRPRDTDFGVGWESLAGAVQRVLFQTDYASSYWTRSSADGRFVAHGASSGTFDAAIIDLQDARVIPVSAFYDPGFFPDNSGFVFQRFDAHFCLQSLLTTAPAMVSLTEPECTTNSNVGLYEHVGAALGGGDYWAVDSQFVSDDGGHNPGSRDPDAFFGGDAFVRLTPLVQTGNGFAQQQTVEVASPYEGDTVISPSASMLVSRVAGADAKQLGYVLRRLDATPGPSGYSVATPEIARYCVRGGKPSFSFDERWMVIHHYVEAADAVDLGFNGPDDVKFQPYLTQGSSNIYLVDLLTGQKIRVTKLAPGQFALYPHFRSDGWMYFLVRTPGKVGETVVASDAALLLDEGN